LADWALLFVKIQIYLFILFAFGLAHAQSTSPVQPMSGMKWKGDLRLRGQREVTWPDDERISSRMRLRFGIKGNVDPNLAVEIRLATAKTNSSTNQTLGESKEPGSARRFIGLDLAYADWKPLSFFKLVAGRISQVHYRPGASQILLDSDLALEGVAAAIDYSDSGPIGVFENAGSSWIRENYDSYYSQEKTDNMLNWGQLGLKWKTDSSTTVIGAGFFNYTALQGMKFSDVSTGGSARGNSEGPGETFKNVYIPRQYFIDTKIQQGPLTYGAFAEHVVNGETLDPNKAWWTGLSVSQERFSVQIAYAELQSDPVPAILTDSDFAGGITDCKGYVLGISYKLRKQLSLALTQYMNRKKTGLDDTQYARTHFDLTAEF